MSFLEYLPYGWDHVLELAIGHAVVVAISLAIAVVIGVSQAKVDVEGQLEGQVAEESLSKNGFI